jgi:hypothetical protein
MKDKIKLLGLPDTEIDYLIRLTENIPSVQDVITFAVREVYTPAIAARFGQYEGADEVYDNAKTDLQAVGMNRDNFAKYWAAHWALPSTQLGYEMLHRGVITEDDLDLLLRSADVMPFWRDKLKAVAYQPLTRVDVRRMHKLGILDVDAVKKAYKDIGYDDSNAQSLTEFTVQYNASPEEQEKTLQDKNRQYYQELTRADILKSFHLGLITETDTRTMLSDLGYKDNDIDFLIAREIYLIEDARRDATIKYIQELYVKNLIDDRTLRVELGKLNLPAFTVDNYIKTWELDRKIKTATPSRADIMSFYAKGIIEEQTARQELSNLGYSDKYIGWYFATAIKAK